jgi:hypothetical protein
MFNSLLESSLADRIVDATITVEDWGWNVITALSPRCRKAYRTIDLAITRGDRWAIHCAFDELPERLRELDDLMSWLDEAQDVLEERDTSAERELRFLQSVCDKNTAAKQ